MWSTSWQKSTRKYNTEFLSLGKGYDVGVGVMTSYIPPVSAGWSGGGTVQAVIKGGEGPPTPRGLTHGTHCSTEQIYQVYLAYILLKKILVETSYISMLIKSPVQNSGKQYR